MPLAIDRSNNFVGDGSYIISNTTADSLMRFLLDHFLARSTEVESSNDEDPRIVQFTTTSESASSVSLVYEMTLASIFEANPWIFFISLMMFLPVSNS